MTTSKVVYEGLDAPDLSKITDAQAAAFYNILQKRRQQGEEITEPQKQFLIGYAEKQLWAYFQETESKTSMLRMSGF